MLAAVTSSNGIELSSPGLQMLRTCATRRTSSWRVKSLLR